MSELSNLNNIASPRGAYINHISLEIPAAGIIRMLEKHIMNINCSRSVSNLLIGDPVICKFIDCDNEYIITGDVTTILDDYSFNILVSNLEKHKNNRKHKRFAVSLNSVVAGVDSMDYICSTVKSISYSGISINSNHDYAIEGHILVSIITSTIDVIHFIGKVVRKNKILDYFEYGVEITSIVSPNKEKLNNFIDSLEEQEKEFAELTQGN